MSELKACPFCGGTPTDKSSISGAIWCEECHSVSNDSERWNTRPIEDAKDAEIKRLREALAKYADHEWWHESYETNDLDRFMFNGNGWELAEAALGGKNE